MSDRSPDAARDVDVSRALSSIEDVVVFIGPSVSEWTFVSQSFQSFFGVSADRVRADATKLLEAVHPEDQDRVATVFDDLASGPSERRFEHRVRHPDVPDRWVRVHVWPVETGGDGQAGIAGVVTDVSEEKHREQELVVLHRLLQHDIRNDISVITGWLDVLAEETEGTQAVIDRVRTASDQMLDLIENTEDIVLSASDDLESEREPTNVQLTLTTILEEKRELYPDVDFELATDTPDVVVAANALLSTVFRNLISNAVKHNDAADPHVEIAVTSRPDSALIEIADNGPGIPEEVSESLFEMGERGKASEGTGLGLYLCQQITDSFDGQIRHEPGDDGGAVFCVDLPLAA